MKEQTQYSVTRSLVRERRTRKGQRGFAMEWIIIVLLVAAAVVGLVMAFSGSLRNMLGTATDVMTSSNVTDVNTSADQYRQQQGVIQGQNQTAKQAGDALGGDFGNAEATKPGNGGGSGTNTEINNNTSVVP